MGCNKMGCGMGKKMGVECKKMGSGMINMECRVKWVYDVLKWGVEWKMGV